MSGYGDRVDTSQFRNVSNSNSQARGSQRALIRSSSFTRNASVLHDNTLSSVIGANEAGSGAAGFVRSQSKLEGLFGGSPCTSGALPPSPTVSPPNQQTPPVEAPKPHDAVEPIRTDETPTQTATHSPPDASTSAYAVTATTASSSTTASGSPSVKTLNPTSPGRIPISPPPVLSPAVPPRTPRHDASNQQAGLVRKVSQLGNHVRGSLVKAPVPDRVDRQNNADPFDAMSSPLSSQPSLDQKASKGAGDERRGRFGPSLSVHGPVRGGVGTSGQIPSQKSGLMPSLSGKLTTLTKSVGRTDGRNNRLSSETPGAAGVTVEGSGRIYVTRNSSAPLDDGKKFRRFASARSDGSGGSQSSSAPLGSGLRMKKAVSNAAALPRKVSKGLNAFFKSRPKSNTSGRI